MAAIGGANTAAGSVTSLPAGVVPAAYLPWITKAAALCPEESPVLIAAQDWQESGFNPNATSSAGAEGIAQFLPSTFATYGQDDAGDGNVSPFNAPDAIMAQGRYMCSLFALAEKSGYPGGAEALALAGYNAGWGAVKTAGGVPPIKQTIDYIAAIQAKAAEWTAQGGVTAISGSSSGPAAVNRALAYLGVPYVWGGGTPNGPSVGFCDRSGNGMLGGTCFASSHSGFDCSSLVQMAWWPTLQLPRTSGDQYAATANHPVSMDALQPGDLIFYSKDGIGAHADHVVMYAGNGMVVEAPHTGLSVQEVPLYKTGGLVGATRPGA
nr:bifunctional lytic transglycosylase/C40 family peptidase [Streptomyces sp. 846.5]